MNTHSAPRSPWPSPVYGDEAHRRAGGRRSVNARRQYVAAKRRAEVSRLVVELGLGWGTQAQISAILKVHRSTISRDIRSLFAPLDPSNEEE